MVEYGATGHPLENILEWLAAAHSMMSSPHLGAAAVKERTKTTSFLIFDVLDFFEEGSLQLFICYLTSRGLKVVSVGL